MSQSMTGFGSGAAKSANYAVTAEIKTVNNRYFDACFHMPRELSALEAELLAMLKEHCKRGKIEVSISIENISVAAGVVLNRIKAEQYLQLIAELEKITGVICDDKVSALLKFPDIVQKTGCAANAELEATVMTAFKEGLTGLTSARQTEGDRLCRDMLKKLQELKSLHREICEIAPGLPARYRERLEQRIAEPLQAQSFSGIDEQRFLTEVLLYADKVAIDEEITRLDSHFTELARLLQEQNSHGRQIDFLLQEINREVNTIGSKANDLDITRCVVLMKTTLEKIREQVQNLE